MTYEPKLDQPSARACLPIPWILATIPHTLGEESFDLPRIHLNSRLNLALEHIILNESWKDQWAQYNYTNKECIV